MIHIRLVSVCEWWFCFWFQTDVHLKVQPADKAMGCDPYYTYFFCYFDTLQMVVTLRLHQVIDEHLIWLHFKVQFMVKKNLKF